MTVVLFESFFVAICENEVQMKACLVDGTPSMENFEMAHVC